MPPGAATKGHRAPNFSINASVPWAYPILEELGFQYTLSVYPVRHGLYGNHRARRLPYLVGPNLLELPLATWRTFNQNLPVGGGAYLRILPFGLMKNGIRAINEKESVPAVLYLHPWEIDSSQPRLRASWKSRLRQYTGLDSMRGRLEQLLQQFSFGTIYDSIYLPAVTQMKQGVCGHRLRDTNSCIAPSEHEIQTMRVLTFTSLFPNSLAPNFGIFVRQRITHFADRGNRVQVVAPVPYAPKSLRGTPLGRMASLPQLETIGGLKFTTLAMLFFQRYLCRCTVF